MTPQDHNRTLGILHAVIGALVMVGFIIAAVSEARRHPSEVMARLGWVLYLLPLMLLQLLTAYGIFTVRRWGRTLALLLSVVYVWVFPLGTLLAVYTYWFLIGGEGKRLYSRRWEQG